MMLYRYLRWRSSLLIKQGERARDLCLQAKMEAGLAQRVCSLVQKGTPPGDVEGQALEDAACLYFLRYTIETFRSGKSEEIVCRMINKMWMKMSDRARLVAVEINYSPEVVVLLAQALMLKEKDVTIEEEEM